MILCVTFFSSQNDIKVSTEIKGGHIGQQIGFYSEYSYLCSLPGRLHELSSNHQGSLLLTYINFNPTMDK